VASPAIAWIFPQTSEAFPHEFNADFLDSLGKEVTKVIRIIS